MKQFFFATIICLSVLSCTVQQTTTIEVVPYPNNVDMKAGTFNIAGAEVGYDPAFDQMTVKAISRFCNQISVVTGQDVVAEVGATHKGISFIMDRSMPEEAYSLNISKNGVKIKASSLNGVIYAIQTIKQMLPSRYMATSRLQARTGAFHAARYRTSRVSHIVASILMRPAISMAWMRSRRFSILWRFTR